MLTISPEDTPRQSRYSWPLKRLEIPRPFSRKDETKTYLEWLQGPFDEGDEACEVDDDGELDEDGGEEEEDQLDSPPVECIADGSIVENNEENDRSYIEFLEAYLDYFDEVKIKLQDNDEQADDIKADSREGDQLEEPCISRGVTRSFMEGMTGDRNTLPYRNQVEVVADFAEQATSPELEQGVAFLDDRNSLGNIPVRRRLWGPLASDQLREELGKPRFNAKSNQIVASDSEDDIESDIVTRSLFIANLSPTMVEAVLATAPRSQALALKNFLYNHLKGKAAIEVMIPSQGFNIIALNLHIPFFVLAESKDLLKDLRMGSDHQPLRQSWRLPYLSGTKAARRFLTQGLCLYESHMSITVIVIDHRVWTAYGSFDTFHGSSIDNVDSYLKAKARTGRPDPLAAGQLPARNLFPTPREYFFKVFELRIKQVSREWRMILETLEEDVERSRETNSLPLNPDISTSRPGVREIGAWSREMVRLLRRLLSGLGNTVDAWDRFVKKDLEFFSFDDGVLTTSPLLISSLNAVDAVFTDLKDIHKKLRQLEEELCRDSPQGVNAHLSHGNHEAQLFQRESARDIRILTIITIAYLPLGLAAAMFSTDLFKPKFDHFILCLFILVVLILVSVTVLFKWHSWVQQIIKYILWVCRKADAPKDLEHG